MTQLLLVMRNDLFKGKIFGSFVPVPVPVIDL